MKRAFKFIQISLLLVFINFLGTVAGYGQDLPDVYDSMASPENQIDQRVTPGIPAEFQIDPFA